MKSETFGYTSEEQAKIIAVITAMVEGATLLEKPIRVYSGKHLTPDDYTITSDSGKEIKIYLYYYPITTIEFNLDCNHKIGFNSIEGMLRIYWRLTGQKFPGTEEFKGVYWLKTAIKNDGPLQELNCVYDSENKRYSPINLSFYKEWFTWYTKHGTL